MKKKISSNENKWVLVVGIGMGIVKIFFDMSLLLKC